MAKLISNHDSYRDKDIIHKYDFLSRALSNENPFCVLMVHQIPAEHPRIRHVSQKLIPGVNELV